jgi:hypothetical protein
VSSVSDTTRWKRYEKITDILGTPVCVGLLAIEAVKKFVGL